MSATPPPERAPWYEAQPDRLAWELEQFADRGLPASVDHSGVDLVVATAVTVAGETHALKVVFPFDYPDVEPTVFGPEDLLDRHQNRRSGNFCLLEDPRLDWWPTMSAAAIVDEDLRWLIEDSRSGPDAVAAAEADMPEPLSQHIAADVTCPTIVTDPFWAVDLPAGDGHVELAAKTLDGLVLVEAEGIGRLDDDTLKQHLEAKSPGTHRGRWVALPQDTLGSWPSENDVLVAAEAASSNLLSLQMRALRKKKFAHADGWVGVTFIEEGPQRGQRRRGWVFLEVRVDRDGNREILKVSRALALTAKERARRIPELAGLVDARVLVVGAGSVGAPTVMELVKAGVGIVDVADYDVYDVNNAVRHVLDIYWAGNDKALAVAVAAYGLNPFVSVRPHTLHVGKRRRDSVKVDQLITDADVVIDATGSQSAARVLARRCREAVKPLVLASLTAGSFGAEAAVFRPDGPCFWCLVLGQQDQTIPSPSEGPRSNITPVGCSTPAFSGAGFDATALAATAARLAVQATGKTDYPSPDHDYVVMNFRGPNPWRHGRMQQHPNCPVCS